MMFEGFKSDIIVNLFDNDIDGDKEMVAFINSLHNPRGIISFVNSAKVEGNEYYKGHKFELALEVYITALNFLVFAKPKSLDEDQTFCDLASALCLNLAACALKRFEFDQAEAVCSLLLCHQPNNAKGLFRKAVALMELHRFSEAYHVLFKASQIEPTNGDIRDKLMYVEGLLSLHKRRHCFDPLDLDSTQKGKKLARENDILGDSSPNNGGVVDMEVGVTAQTTDEGLAPSAMALRCDEIGSNGIERVRVADDYLRSTTTNVKKKDLLCFSSTKNKGCQLRISPNTYERLLQGQKISYYHSKLGSTVTVRACDHKKPKDTSVPGSGEQVRNNSAEDHVDSSPSLQTNHLTESFGDSINQDADELNTICSVSTLVDTHMVICHNTNAVVVENCGDRSSKEKAAMSSKPNLDSHSVVSHVDSFNGHSTNTTPRRRNPKHLCSPVNINQPPRRIPSPFSNMFECRSRLKRKCSQVRTKMRKCFQVRDKKHSSRHRKKSLRAPHAFCSFLEDPPKKKSKTVSSGCVLNYALCCVVGEASTLANKFFLFVNFSFLVIVSFVKKKKKKPPHI